MAASDNGKTFAYGSEIQVFGDSEVIRDYYDLDDGDGSLIFMESKDNEKVILNQDTNLSLEELLSQLRENNILPAYEEDISCRYNTNDRWKEGRPSFEGDYYSVVKQNEFPENISFFSLSNKEDGYSFSWRDSVTSLEDRPSKFPLNEVTITMQCIDSQKMKKLYSMIFDSTEIEESLDNKFSSRE